MSRPALQFTVGILILASVSVNPSANAPRIVAGLTTAPETLVVVCTNPTSHPLDFILQFADHRRWQLASTHVTDATRDLSPVAPSGPVHHFTVPAQSVTTFDLVRG